ncbi:helix-turn-helix domain-containing protein, partial [Butyrivibrio sp. YAB3001]|uniref:helix-turn-helix domain-containing protein n=1 Tax=Butyrivibrio sp. YAB3001 TaxID=1520812 RepID=UPI0008F68D9C
MPRKTIEKGNMSLAELLKQMRKDSGRFQKDLAKLLGVKSVTYSAYETGRIIPSADKLNILAKLYGVSPEVFLARLDENEELENELKIAIAQQAGKPDSGNSGKLSETSESNTVLPSAASSEFQKIKDD